MNKPAQIDDTKPLQVLSDQMRDMRDKWRASLPAHISVERFERVVITAIQSNPDLVNADRFSLWQACSKAANDGLYPDGKEGALVVYNTKVKRNNAELWIKQVQWMPMIFGIRKKVRQSGEVIKFDAQVVHAKDVFDYQLGDDPKIIHKPFMGDGDPGPVIAAYSIAVLKSPGTASGTEISREIMTRSQIDKVRLMSKAADGPAWKGWFEEMARKTVARRHSKVLPMSTDVDALLNREVADIETGELTQAPPRPSLSHFMAGAADPEPAEPEAEAPKDPEPDKKTTADSASEEVQAELLPDGKKPPGKDNV